MPDVTEVLSRIEQGDIAASDELLPLVYGELRRLAASKLAHEKPGQTLQATALVHDAYLRLVDTEKAQDWSSRGHFFAAAAEAMRQILVNNAIRKQRPKHGGDRQRVDLDSAIPCSGAPDKQIVEVSQALDRLAQVDGEVAELVKLKYFAGLSIAEIASILGVSQRTVDRRWAYARAWLHQELVAVMEPGEETEIRRSKKI